MDDVADIADLLREHGYRFTRPRRVVWEVLTDAAGHLTAEQIADRADDLTPGVNLASVYRSLAVLSDLELVRESRLGESDAAVWEITHPDEHFHLVCEVCGEVTHHGGELVEDVRRHLEHDHGFDVRSVELVVAGRCRGCGADSELES